MTAEKEKLVTRFLVNASITQPALRNQGKGIINSIRNKLIEVFSIEAFMKNLKAKTNFPFEKYLDEITNSIYQLPGLDKNNNENGCYVSWGTARKCVNLLLRSFVYSGYVWEVYDIKEIDFSNDTYMQKLEIPLDSNVVNGLKDRLSKLNPLGYDRNIFKGFTITHLQPEHSKLLQKQAELLSEELHMCKIDLDLILWRANSSD